MGRPRFSPAARPRPASSSAASTAAGAESRFHGRWCSACNSATSRRPLSATRSCGASAFTSGRAGHWMSELLQAAIGIVLVPAVLLDLSPVLLAASLLLTATGRPIFTGLALVSLGAGFALADRTKREALREPVVFSDMSELPHVFTHPQLYLPFAGAGLVIGGVLATIAFGIALLSVEPPLWPPDASLIVILAAVVGAAVWVISR